MNKYLQRRTVKTPSKFTFQRKGPREKMFTYVIRFAVQVWLDTYYPGHWSFEVIDKYYDENTDKLSVLGKVTVMEDDGVRRVITAWGDADLTRDKDGNYHTGQDTFKAADRDWETLSLSVFSS